MEEGEKGERRRRHSVLPLLTWPIVLHHRAGAYLQRAPAARAGGWLHPLVGRESRHYPYRERNHHVSAQQRQPDLHGEGIHVREEPRRCAFGYLKQWQVVSVLSVWESIDRSIEVMTRARDVSRHVFAVLLKTDVENPARESPCLYATSASSPHFWGSSSQTARWFGWFFARISIELGERIILQCGTQWQRARGVTACCFSFQRRGSLKPREAIEIPERGGPS